MKRARSAYLTLIAVLLSPMVANADLISWEFTGQISVASGSSSSSVGDLFRVVVGFDTDATLVQAQTGGIFGAGTRYEYDGSGVSFHVSLQGQADQSITPFGEGLDFIWLRDNSADRACCEFDEVDGLTFALLDANAFGVSIILRGSILDIFSGGELPTNPDPRLLDLEIAAFQWTVEDGLTIGEISSITRVPEPGTLALLAIGLLGMGFAGFRRRV